MGRPAVTDQLARRLAIASWMLTIAVTVIALAVRIGSGAPPLPTRFALGDAATAAIGLLQVATTTVALLILVRLPRHRVGWLLMATGLFYAISILAGAIAFAAIADGPTGLAIARWGGWFAFVTSTISGVTLVAIAFVFPDGHISSPMLARLLPLFAGVALVVGLAMTLQPGPMFLLTSLDNPLGIGPDVVNTLPMALLGAIAAVYVLGPVALAATVVSRFRRSHGVERLQLKWFVAAAILMMISLGFAGGLGFVASDGPAAEWPLVAFALAATTMPVTIGIAILRYRLYAIDRIISRTISYGVVTAVLVIVFAVVVVGLQALLTPFTRGDSVPVAASTLVVFALFQPVRRRVQAAVDQRFNRAHYDAERTASDLAERLRHQIDLAALSDDIAGVVDTALRPTKIGVWLRRPVRDASGMTTP